MTRSRSLLFVSLFASAAVAVACSSSSSSPTDGGLAEAGDATTSDVATEDASTDDVAESAPPADAADAAPLAINGCTAADFAANDHTAANDPRIITAPDVAAPSQFLPHCMRVKANQTITWRGDLGHHPIGYTVTLASGADAGDASSSFVVGLPDGALTQNTGSMTEPGTIAFICEEHPGSMFGAVDVVP